jgi:hypothetical protein
MKKRVKRTKSKSSLKRGRAKSKSKRTTSAKKTFLPKAKRVAKKAALAAGAAAIGTALSELQPEQKGAGRDASDESESKPRKHWHMSRPLSTRSLTLGKLSCATFEPSSHLPFPG